MMPYPRLPRGVIIVADEEKDDTDTSAIDYGEVTKESAESAVKTFFGQSRGQKEAVKATRSLKDKAADAVLNGRTYGSR